MTTVSYSLSESGMLSSGARQEAALSSMARYEMENLTDKMAVNQSTDMGDYSEERLFQAFYISYLWTALIVGLPGNVIIAVVYVVVRQKRTSDWFIFFLSVYDCAVCLFAVPLYLSIETGTWVATGSDLACKVEQFTIFTAQFSSVCMLGIIAVDRYLKICHPTRRSLNATQARNLGFCTPIISAIVAAPILVWDGNVERRYCRVQEQYKGTLGVKMHLCLTFGFFLCMFVVVIFCYSRVCFAVRRRIQRHRENALKRKHLMQIPAFLQAISNVDDPHGLSSHAGRNKKRFSLFSIGSSRRLSAISPWIKARLSLPSDGCSERKLASTGDEEEVATKEKLVDIKRQLDYALMHRKQSASSGKMSWARKKTGLYKSGDCLDKVEQTHTIAPVTRESQDCVQEIHTSPQITRYCPDNADRKYLIPHRFGQYPNNEGEIYVIPRGSGECPDNLQGIQKNTAPDQIKKYHDNVHEMQRHDFPPKSEEDQHNVEEIQRNLTLHKYRDGQKTLDDRHVYIVLHKSGEGQNNLHDIQRTIILHRPRDGQNNAGVGCDYVENTQTSNRTPSDKQDIDNEAEINCRAADSMLQVNCHDNSRDAFAAEYHSESQISDFGESQTDKEGTLLADKLKHADADVRSEDQGQRNAGLEKKENKDKKSPLSETVGEIRTSPDSEDKKMKCKKCYRISDNIKQESNASDVEKYQPTSVNKATDSGMSSDWMEKPCDRGIDTDMHSDWTEQAGDIGIDSDMPTDWMEQPRDKSIGSNVYSGWVEKRNNLLDTEESLVSPGNTVNKCAHSNNEIDTVHLQYKHWQSKRKHAENAFTYSANELSRTTYSNDCCENSRHNAAEYRGLSKSLRSLFTRSRQSSFKEAFVKRKSWSAKCRSASVSPKHTADTSKSKWSQLRESTSQSYSDLRTTQAESMMKPWILQLCFRRQISKSAAVEDIFTENEDCSQRLIPDYKTHEGGHSMKSSTARPRVESASSRKKSASRNRSLAGTHEMLSTNLPYMKLVDGGFRAHGGGQRYNNLGTHNHDPGEGDIINSCDHDDYVDDDGTVFLLGDCGKFRHSSRSNTQPSELIFVPNSSVGKGASEYSNVELVKSRDSHNTDLCFSRESHAHELNSSPMNDESRVSKESNKGKDTPVLISYKVSENNKQEATLTCDVSTHSNKASCNKCTSPSMEQNKIPHIVNKAVNITHHPSHLQLLHLGSCDSLKYANLASDGEQVVNTDLGVPSVTQADLNNRSVLDRLPAFARKISPLASATKLPHAAEKGSGILHSPCMRNIHSPRKRNCENDPSVGSVSHIGGNCEFNTPSKILGSNSKLTDVCLVCRPEEAKPKSSCLTREDWIVPENSHCLKKQQENKCQKKQKGFTCKNSNINTKPSGFMGVLPSQSDRGLLSTDAVTWFPLSEVTDIKENTANKPSSKNSNYLRSYSETKTRSDWTKEPCDMDIGSDIPSNWNEKPCDTVFDSGSLSDWIMESRDIETDSDINYDLVRASRDLGIGSDMPSDWMREPSGHLDQSIQTYGDFYACDCCGHTDQNSRQNGAAAIEICRYKCIFPKQEAHDVINELTNHGKCNCDDSLHSGGLIMSEVQRSQKATEECRKSRNAGLADVDSRCEFRLDTLASSDNLYWLGRQRCCICGSQETDLHTTDRVGEMSEISEKCDWKENAQLSRGKNTPQRGHVGNNSHGADKIRSSCRSKGHSLVCPYVSADQAQILTRGSPIIGSGVQIDLINRRDVTDSGRSRHSLNTHQRTNTPATIRPSDVCSPQNKNKNKHSNDTGQRAESGGDKASGFDFSQCLECSLVGLIDFLPQDKISLVDNIIDVIVTRKLATIIDGNFLPGVCVRQPQNAFHTTVSNLNRHLLNIPRLETNFPTTVSNPKHHVLDTFRPHQTFCTTVLNPNRNLFKTVALSLLHFSSKTSNLYHQNQPIWGVSSVHNFRFKSYLHSLYKDNSTKYTESNLHIQSPVVCSMPWQSGSLENVCMFESLGIPRFAHAESLLEFSVGSVNFFKTRIDNCSSVIGSNLVWEPSIGKPTPFLTNVNVYYDHFCFCKYFWSRYLNEPFNNDVCPFCLKPLCFSGFVVFLRSVSGSVPLIFSYKEEVEKWLCATELDRQDQKSICQVEFPVLLDSSEAQNECSRNLCCNCEETRAQNRDSTDIFGEESVFCNQGHQRIDVLRVPSMVGNSATRCRLVVRNSATRCRHVTVPSNKHIGGNYCQDISNVQPVNSDNSYTQQEVTNTPTDGCPLSASSTSTHAKSGSRCDTHGRSRLSSDPGDTRVLFSLTTPDEKNTSRTERGVYTRVDNEALPTDLPEEGPTSPYKFHRLSHSLNLQTNIRQEFGVNIQTNKKTNNDKVSQEEDEIHRHENDCSSWEQPKLTSESFLLHPNNKLRRFKLSSSNIVNCALNSLVPLAVGSSKQGHGVEAIGIASYQGQDTVPNHIPGTVKMAGTQGLEALSQEYIENSNSINHPPGSQVGNMVSPVASQDEEVTNCSSDTGEAKASNIIPPGTTKSIHSTLLGCVPTFQVDDFETKCSLGDVRASQTQTCELFVRSVFDTLFTSESYPFKSDPCLTSSDIDSSHSELLVFPLSPIFSRSAHRQKEINPSCPDSSVFHIADINRQKLNSTFDLYGARVHKIKSPKRNGMVQSWFSLDDISAKTTNSQHASMVFLTSVRRQLNNVLSPKSIRQFFGINNAHDNRTSGRKPPCSRDTLSANQINVIITRCDSLVMDKRREMGLPPIRDRAATLDPAALDKPARSGYDSATLSGTGARQALESSRPKPRASSLDTSYSSNSHSDDPSVLDRSQDLSLDLSPGASLHLLSPNSASFRTGSMCSEISTLSKLTECSAYTEHSRSDCEKITRRTAEREHNITKLLGVITLVFVLSWSVSWTVILIDTLAALPLTEILPTNVSLSIARNLFLVNHFCNILVYIVLSRSFRDKMAECYKSCTSCCPL